MVEDLSTRHDFVGDLFERPGSPEEWDRYRLSDEQIESYRKNGYLIVENLLAGDHRNCLCQRALDVILDRTESAGSMKIMMEGRTDIQSVPVEEREARAQHDAVDPVRAQLVAHAGREQARHDDVEAPGAQHCLERCQQEAVDDRAELHERDGLVAQQETDADVGDTEQQEERSELEVP